MNEVQGIAGGLGVHGDDRNLFVEFFRHPVQSGYQTELQGRPVFMEFDFVRIMIPGDKNTKIERKATANDKERFPRAWQAYQNKEQPSFEGTLLKEWPAITVSMVAELNALNVFTVDQLARLSDSQVQKIGMGGLDLRAKAGAFLEAAKDGSAVQRYAAENERLKGQVEQQNVMLTELAARIEALEAGGKAKTKG
jgi:hypothetical protein